MANLDEITRTPRLKIERAKHHIDDLNRKTAAYLGQKPFQLVFVRKESSDRVIPILKSEIPIPPELSLIIGDAVHNLRAALDHLVWQMAGHLAVQPKNVQFPFPVKPVSEQGFRDAILGREIQRAGKHVVEAIVTLNAQPGGDELIYGVHTLDITDKHKLVVTTAESATLVRRLTYPSNPAFSVDWMNAQWIRPTSNKTPKGWVEEQAEVQPAFFISFGNGEPFVGQEAVTVLRNMADRITEAVELLAAAYFLPP